MRIIDSRSLSNMFLEFLDEAKYQLEQEGYNEVTAIKFGSDEYPHDRIFLEYGFYNEAIQQVPNTEEELITPGIFCYDGADIVNNPSYDAYNVEVAFEFLGFESQREILRRLLEKFAIYLRGKSILISYKDNTFAWGETESDIDTTGEVYNGIISVEMPQLLETVSQSGYDRFNAYINLDITVLGNISLDNTISIELDNENIPLSNINIERNKTIKTMNVRAKEAKSYAENQTLSFSIEGLFNRNSAACRKIQKCILESDYLNESFSLEYAGHQYTMYLQKGSINIQPNIPTTFTAVFSLLQEL